MQSHPNQVEIHRKFRCIVPEITSRKHIEMIIFVIKENESLLSKHRATAIIRIKLRKLQQVRFSKKYGISRLSL